MKHLFLLFLPIFSLLACNQKRIVPSKMNTQQATVHSPALIVLGTCQDGGSPHAGCKKECCADLFVHPDPNRMVVSLGLIDPATKQQFMFEATPDFSRQLHLLQHFSDFGADSSLDGIFLTHAHIGHYTGLMYLGKEAMSATNTPVYSMPRMKSFLEQNGPWSQLVNFKNIHLIQLTNETSVNLSKTIHVIPFVVPHRDEYSETVGYKITGPHKTALFIPDINKWDKWNTSIVDNIKHVDYAFIDATFYGENELKNRDMSAIPHPFVKESLKLFKSLSKEDRAKIIFIHLNHSNPLWNVQSSEYKNVISLGYKIAKKGDVYYL